MIARLDDLNGDEFGSNVDHLSDTGCDHCPGWVAESYCNVPESHEFTDAGWYAALKSFDEEKGLMSRHGEEQTKIASCMSRVESCYKCRMIFWYFWPDLGEG